MVPMCSVTEYAARFDVPEGKEQKLEATLEDATVLIAAELGGWVKGDDPALDDVCMAVCRAVAHRAMVRAADGVTQYMQTAGSYSGQVTYSNPNGDLYLTASDRSMLGTDGCSIGFARLA